MRPSAERHSSKNVASAKSGALMAITRITMWCGSMWPAWVTGAGGFNYSQVSGCSGSGLAVTSGLPQSGLTHDRRLTKEHRVNYVLSSFREDIMFRAVVEEAAALASISLFLGMIAVWAQVISAM